jgi:hypothetical protein
MPKPRVELLLHLRLSDDASGTAAEPGALLRRRSNVVPRRPPGPELVEPIDGCTHRVPR